MSTSILPNARNVQFNGDATFIAGNVVYHGRQSGPEKVGLEFLREQCALDALVDSNERFDAPRCSPETRGKIVQDIITWVNNNSRSASMFWLYGSAGAGKSALLQTIAQRLKVDGRLLASFFFSRTANSPGRSDGHKLIPTLVYQLILAFPETRTRIEACIKEDPSIFNRTRDVQMASLFLKPLKRFSLKRSLKKIFKRQAQIRLIVIDGLDECRDSDILYDLLKIMATAVAELHLPFRFLVASRPEPHIRRTFDHEDCFKRISLQRLDLDQDPDAQADIRHFLQQEFSKIRRTHPLGQYLHPSWPAEDVIEGLLLKSSTQFIYTSTVIKYIQSPSHRPDDRLLVILRIAPRPTNDKPLAQLDALYSFIFSSVQPENRDITWRILGILHVRVPGPDDKKLDSTPLLLEEVLNLRQGDVNLLLDPLSSVISCPANREELIVILHASLFDYLLDQSRSEDWFLDLQDAHESLAMYFYRKLQGDLMDTTTNLNAENQHIFHLFMHHAQYARPSEELKLVLISLPFNFSKALGTPDNPDWPVFICMVVDRLLNVCLRQEFYFSTEQLCRCLYGIYSHMKAQLLQDGKYQCEPYGDPESRCFPVSPILNLSSQIYRLVLNYQETYHPSPEKYLIPSIDDATTWFKRMSNQLRKLPGGGAATTRRVLHFFIIFLPVSDKFCSKPISTLYLFHRDKNTGLPTENNNSEVDGELEEIYRQIANTFKMTHTTTLVPKALEFLSHTLARPADVRRYGLQYLLHRFHYTMVTK